jgi:chromosome segregation ATPase
MLRQELTIRDIIQNLFPAQIYRNCAVRMRSINSEMQDMLINLYTVLSDLSKESNDNQMDNIAELSKQYNEMVLVSPIREQLDSVQKKLNFSQEQLATTQEQLATTQEQLVALQEQLEALQEQLHKGN